MTWLLVFFLLSHSQERVENGDVVPASDDLARSVALMKLSTGGSCSAGFLTSKVLLTAGHCTSHSSVSGTSVRVMDVNGKWQQRSVVKVITHPQYKLEESQLGAMVSHDIGLLILEKPFDFAVRPLKLGSVAGMSQPTDVTIIGYGWNGPHTGSGKLRKGVMTAIVQKEDNYYGAEGIYMEPKDDQALCPGDSGGPVIKGTRTLIGINSLSSACQNDPAPHSVAEIAWAAKAWIQKQAPDVP